MFLAVFSVVYFGMHYFIYLRVAAGLSLGFKELLFLKIVLVAGSTAFFAGMFYRAFPPLFALLRAGNVWLGIIAITFAVLMAKMPLDFIFPAQVKPFTVAATALAILLSGYSLYNVSNGPRVRELRIPVKNLSAGADGIRLAHVSDLHLSRLKDAAWLEGVVSAVNAQKPDIVVITGDLIDDDTGGLQPFVPVLKKLTSKYGVFAVPGNHDHYSVLDNMRVFARQSGIRVLENEKVAVGGAVTLLGVDDENGAVMDEYRDFLGKTLKGERLPVVLLKHRPVEFGEAADAGVFLQLSGHTHAGQIPPLDLIVRLIFRYPYGLYQRGGSYIYTTCGTGTWGPPMRLFSRSEIAVITLFPQTPKIN